MYIFNITCDTDVIAFLLNNWWSDENENVFKKSE